MSSTILAAHDLRVGYGSQQVLNDLSFELSANEICGVIGPNGAGKTTFLKALYGLLKLQAGRVFVDGEDVSNTSVKKRIDLRLSYVPQEKSVFPNLTVVENLELATDALPRDRQTNSIRQQQLVFELFPRLQERKQQLAGTMSGGEQRMVAIAIGLMSQPRVLLLDEPTTGLAPQVVHSLMDVVKKLNQEFGIATIIVEQNILSTARIADRMFVIKEGRGSNLAGRPNELTKPQMLEYL